MSASASSSGTSDIGVWPAAGDVAELRAGNQALEAAALAREQDHVERAPQDQHGHVERREAARLGVERVRERGVEARSAREQLGLLDQLVGVLLPPAREAGAREHRARDRVAEQRLRRGRVARHPPHAAEHPGAPALLAAVLQPGGRDRGDACGRGRGGRARARSSRRASCRRSERDRSPRAPSRPRPRRRAPRASSPPRAGTAPSGRTRGGPRRARRSAPRAAGASASMPARCARCRGPARAARRSRRGNGRARACGAPYLGAPKPRMPCRASAPTSASAGRATATRPASTTASATAAPSRPPRTRSSTARGDEPAGRQGRERHRGGQRRPRRDPRARARGRRPPQHRRVHDPGRDPSEADRRRADGVEQRERDPEPRHAAQHGRDDDRARHAGREQVARRGDDHRGRDHERDPRPQEHRRHVAPVVAHDRGERGREAHEAGHHDPGGRRHRGHLPLEHRARLAPGAEEPRHRREGHPPDRLEQQRRHLHHPPRERPHAERAEPGDRAHGHVHELLAGHGRDRAGLEHQRRTPRAGARRATTSAAPRARAGRPGAASPCRRPSAAPPRARAPIPRARPRPSRSRPRRRRAPRSRRRSRSRGSPGAARARAASAPSGSRSAATAP